MTTTGEHGAVCHGNLVPGKKWLHISSMANFNHFKVTT